MTINRSRLGWRRARWRLMSVAVVWNSVWQTLMQLNRTGKIISKNRCCYQLNKITSTDKHIQTRIFAAAQHNPCRSLVRLRVVCLLSGLLLLKTGRSGYLVCFFFVSKHILISFTTLCLNKMFNLRIYPPLPTQVDSPA